MLQRLSTGVSGLDEILKGGLIKGKTYLFRGGPGTGKTTLGLHYLIAGKPGKSLYVSLTEPQADLRQNAENVGLSLTSVDFLDLSPSKDFYEQSAFSELFISSTIHDDTRSGMVIDFINQGDYKRIFLDSITAFQLQVPNPRLFRKQFQSFLKFVSDKQITLVLTSELSTIVSDTEICSIVDGVLNLELNEGYRNISISKFRGSDFRTGKHSFRLTDKGMAVFPELASQRLVDHTNYQVSISRISAGIPEIDELLDGGIEHDTTTIISGPSGVGKTTLSLQFMKEAAGRGERSTIFCFEESMKTLIGRAENTNIPVLSMMKKGTLQIIPADDVQYSIDEFAAVVRQQVEQYGSRIILIDSLAGLIVSAVGDNSDSKSLLRKIHSIVVYLRNKGVTLFLTTEISEITGDFRVSEMAISYLADNIIFLRYIEINSQLKKSIGVLKKRLSHFEESIRSFEITQYGLKVGEPLVGLQNILSGQPEFKPEHAAIRKKRKK